MQLRSICAGAFLASAFLAAPAFADDVVFMVDNQSSYAVREFYASPVDAETWEDDILGADVLPSGEAVRITIPDGGDVCAYDLRVVFEDGDVAEDRAIDLCGIGSYTITD